MMYEVETGDKPKFQEDGGPFSGLKRPGFSGPMGGGEPQVSQICGRALLEV